MTKQQGDEAVRDEIRQAADRIWERFQDAYHWGDGFQAAYNEIAAELQAAEERGAAMYQCPKCAAQEVVAAENPCGNCCNCGCGM